MKKVGAFLLHANSNNALQIYSEVKDKINIWLASKGTIKDNLITYGDGRTCTLNTAEFEVDAYLAYRVAIREAIPAGFFNTHIIVGVRDKEIEVECQLYVGSNPELVSPFEFDARVPKIIREIISMPYEWHVGNTLLSSKELIIDKSSAADVADIIRSEKRNLPVIIVSTYDNVPFDPNLASDLARDTCGLANVILVNDAVSWELTKILGKIWSCYGGAIRLYWPMIQKDDPFQHPLWLPMKLLEINPDTKKASFELRNVIRKELFSIGSFAIRPSSLITDVIDMFTKKRRTATYKAASDAKEYRKLLELQDEDYKDLKKKYDDVLELNKSLEQDIYNLNRKYSYYQNPTSTALEAEKETPPSTVLDAVMLAMKKWSDCILFADNIDEGPVSVEDNAGPPNKIFRLLATIYKAAKIMQVAPLGKDLKNWLLDNNVKTSSESITTANNKSLYDQRKFPFSGENIQFDEHIKVSDGTSPSKCVRIYYQWSTTQKKMLIGWVGRHLDT